MGIIIKYWPDWPESEIDEDIDYDERVDKKLSIREIYELFRMNKLRRAGDNIYFINIK
jgi:hypothetical protein